MTEAGGARTGSRGTWSEVPGGRMPAPKRAPPPAGWPASGGGTTRSWRLRPLQYRRDAVFQLLGIQLEGAGILARGGLDLGLLLLGELETDVLLLGHGCSWAGWVSTARRDASAVA